ncbi:MAG: hypothetical protein FD180_2910 [Planctomycetota bacterium]|nr:MAG: hypothetical protein FD180_2910 [Planctomycetota bacterium]
MNFRIAFALAFLSVAVAGCGPGSITVTKGDRKLTLFEPESTTVKQGETVQVTLKIARDKMTDPVTVRFEGLPAGVTADSSTTMPNGQDSANISFTATAAAKAVSNHEVRVIADASGGMVAKTAMQLTVKEK